MPLYMSTFGYKPEVWAGLVKSPENREETVGRIAVATGATLRTTVIADVTPFTAAGHLHNNRFVRRWGGRDEKGLRNSCPRTIDFACASVGE
jgi:hypothetical protein